MKRILMFAVVAIVISGCSKDKYDDTDPPGEPSWIEQQIAELKIKPSNAKDIKFFSVHEKQDAFQFYGGVTVDNKTWLSKFDASGNEIYTIKIKDEYQGLKNTLPSTCNHLGLLDNNMILLINYITDAEGINYLPDIFSRKSVSRLYILDFITGKELFASSFTANPIIEVNAIRTPFSYFIESSMGNSPYSLDRELCYYSASLDGKKFWERNIGEGEMRGLWHYGAGYNEVNDEILDNKMFLNDESFAYVYRARDSSICIEGNCGWIFPVYKLRNINIKNYEIIYEADIPIVEYAYQAYYNTFNQWCVMGLFDKGNLMRVEYVEYSYKAVLIDPISEAYRDERTIVNQYYYDINKETGAIVGSGKL